MTSNIFKDSTYQMANVSNKAITKREALATGKITVGKEVFEKIKAKDMPKGDPISLAETAAILGAKKTADIIPLCHPLGLDHVSVAILAEGEQSFRVYCLATTSSKTGVEMEALNAVSSALLTIWDLSKPVYADLRIDEIYLLQKTGGKSGLWQTNQSVPDSVKEYLLAQEDKPFADLNFAIFTMSTRAAKGVYEDGAGKYMIEAIEAKGGTIVDYKIIPDDADELKKLVANSGADITFVCGGTGLSAEDKTPEALSELFSRPAPGIAELLRAEGSKFTYKSWLSRQNAGVINESLTIAFPGSLKACKENLQIIEKVLPHAVKMMRGGGHD